MARVIIAYEKHDDRLIDASTDERFAQAAHDLLAERLASGHFYYDPDEWDKNNAFVIERKKRDARLMELTDEQVDQFPDRVAGVMKAERARITAQDREAEQARKFLALVRDTVDKGRQGDFQVKRWRGAGGECPKAWAILLRRCEHEYERVELRETS